MAEYNTITEHNVKEKIFDTVIIGGGPAGLAAALYAKRYEMRVLVIAKEPGGLLTQTHIVENYPGILPMSGPDMMDLFIKQVTDIGVDIVNKTVISISQTDDKWFHVCTDDECYSSKTVIYATGTKHRELSVPGEKEYRNKGVSYCATCDGPLFRNVPVAIVGGGDSAAKEALLLSKYASQVYIIARSTLKAEPVNATRVRNNDKIIVLEGTQVKEVFGDGKLLSGVTLSKPFNGSEKLDIEGLFVAIGHLPQTSLVKDLDVELDSHNQIKIDRASRTSLKGFYAAGDCTDTPWKQAIISAAEGSQAANSAYEDLTHKVVQTK